MTPKGTSYIFEMGRVIYAVFPDSKMAADVARIAIENRLAACANIFQPHQAIYRWNGKVEMAAEVAVIFKTTAEKSTALIQHIRKNHSYETPAILEFGMENTTAEFAKWLQLACQG